VKGTRIPVRLVLGYLASGAAPEEIIEEFPDLTAEDISACLIYARDLSEFEVAAQPMRFFADHCVPRSIGETLISGGHEVIRLSTQLPSDADDSTVIEEAQEMGAILLSLNGDFADLIRYPPEHYGGSLPGRFGIVRRQFLRLWTSYSSIWSSIHVRSTTVESYSWLRPTAFGFDVAPNTTPLITPMHTWRKAKAFFLWPWRPRGSSQRTCPNFCR